MGLKLCQHNHDRQIAEYNMPLYCVAFVAWHKSGLFYFEGEDDMVKKYSELCSKAKLLFQRRAFSRPWKISVCNVQQKNYEYNK